MPSAPFELKTKIYRAGAGAGKTTRLVDEVYEFYKFFKTQNNRNPRVVLTTFTRKATQELRERLMIEAQKKSDLDFLNFILSKNHLHISTIHGVLQIFLRQNAQKIDLDPGFSLVDDKDVLAKSKSILKKILEKDGSYLDLLEEYTFRGLTQFLLSHDKTKFLSNRIAPFDIKDFEKCLNDVIKTFLKNLKEAATEITDSTQDAKWVEYAQAVSSLDGDLEKIQSRLSELKKPNLKKADPAISEDLNERIMEMVREIKSFDMELANRDKWNLYIQSSEKFQQLSTVFSKDLGEWKKSTGSITMNDFELFSLEVLKNHPELVRLFSDSFDYWLIDEFQDTSPLQLQLIEKFTENKKYFVVGDPQQSIYFFRGARAEVFDNVQKKIVTEGGLLLELKKNFRSDKPVMSFINYFFKNYSFQFSPMDLGGPDSTNKNVAQIKLCSSEQAQNIAMANRVVELSAQGVPLSQICIIGKKNDHLKKIAEHLFSKKIPHILHAASGFQDRREILDALAILKFLVNPHDNFNLIQILRSPWFFVADEDIYLVTQSGENSFWKEFLKKQDEENFLAIKKLKNYLDSCYQKGVSNVFQSILVETGMFDFAAQYDSSGRRESNLWKLLVQLKAEDHKAGFQYLDFIGGKTNSLDLDSGSEDSDAVSAIEPNRVQLMTVHMSKGLEFDHVLLPYIDREGYLTRHQMYTFDESNNQFGLSLKLDGETSKMSLPASACVKKMAGEEQAESDRLLYVSMTRAKKTIFMSTSGAKRSSSSWFKKIGIPLEIGDYKQAEFEYSVAGDATEESIWTSKETLLKKIPEKLFDLGSLAKKIKSEAVTTQKVLDQEKSLDLLERAQRGRLAHRVFEAMKYGQSGHVDLNPETKNALEYVSTLKEIPMERILKEGYAEWGFTSNATSQSVSGQIDLWAQLDDQLWIIDYKTGSSRYSDAAFEQLLRYSEVLRAYVPSSKINLVALYPFEQKFFQRKL